MTEQRIFDQAEIDRTRDLFRKAELNLKSAEHLTNNVFIPAVNELRYAGNHLFRYLCDGDKDGLLSAQKHCKRAIYDAAEGPLLKFLGDVVQFQDDYSKEPCVTDVMSDYVVHMKKVQDARNLIAKVQPASREEYFELVEPHLNTLSEIVNLLDAARPEINKRMRRDSQNRRWVYVGLIIAVVGAVFAVIGPISTT